MYDEFNKLEKDDKNSLPPTVIFTRSFKDIDKIIAILELKRDVIVNISNMDKLSRIRIIDFISGYIFAKNGYKKKYEKNIYLFHY